MNDFSLFNRKRSLFSNDMNNLDTEISKIIKNSRFLIIGGAGSIGQSVSFEIFKRDPKLLHIVDISENNLVELVRFLRSSEIKHKGELKTFALDCGSEEFEALISEIKEYDYVFNLSALKHVRSEKDPYTLMRLIKVNIFNTIKTLNLTKHSGLRNYFCVSTDKATNPVNMMGASKKIMETFLMKESLNQNISLARFANVAFSDGSLLHGFNNRIKNEQPLSAPIDVERYFITQQESGELCLLSGLFGESRDIFFPKISEELKLMKFSEIAKNYLNNLGFKPIIFDKENESKDQIKNLIAEKKWPCYFFESSTTGEKPFEEFFTDSEKIDLQRFESIGVIKNEAEYDEYVLTRFEDEIMKFKDKKVWNKEDLIEIFRKALPNFNHIETGKNLDQKM